MNCKLGAGLQFPMQFETKEVLRNRFTDTALFDFEMRFKEQFPIL